MIDLNFEERQERGGEGKGEEKCITAGRAGDVEEDEFSPASSTEIF